MKKALSLIIIMHLCLLCGLDAQNLVTEAETRTAAVRYAQSFLQYKNISFSNIVSIDSYEDNTITLMREVVFDNGLSILLSAYRPCLPVLLYSTNNTSILPNIESIPDGLRDFIQNYAGTIAYASDESRNLNEHSDWALLLGKNLSDTITRSDLVYGPLLTTQWGQSTANFGNINNAYNYYVSETGNYCLYDTCPTGCVATAMAQIMKYWNYPVYMPNKVEQYDWCNMPNRLQNISYNYSTGFFDTNYNYVAERNAIARLMADCGNAASMNYCYYQCESFTLPINARNALVYIFDYHSDATRELRSSYTTRKWKEMLVENIVAGRPVLYAGISLKSKVFDHSGHAFVCDGYNENTGKFHFNWGHLGFYDSVWCTVDSIIEGNHNWNHLERAVFNIRPNQTMDYCNIPLSLEMHYLNYYNILGIISPDPYANVPKTFTRLISVPNAYQSSWRTIPTGAISEYVAHEEVILQDGFLAETGSDFYAHISPCASCDDRMVAGETSDVAGGENDNPTDTLPAPKSLQTDATQSDDAALTVYPNPTDELLYIELSGAGIASVALYDLQGRLVETLRAKSLQGGTATVNMRNVPAGVYVLRVTDANGKEYRQKIVRR